MIPAPSYVVSADHLVATAEIQHKFAMELWSRALRAYADQDRSEAIKLGMAAFAEEKAALQLYTQSGKALDQSKTTLEDSAKAIQDQVMVWVSGCDAPPSSNGPVQNREPRLYQGLAGRLYDSAQLRTIPEWLKRDLHEAANALLDAKKTWERYSDGLIRFFRWMDLGHEEQVDGQTWKVYPAMRIKTDGNPQSEERAFDCALNEAERKKRSTP